jgi:hypothetical protein
LYNIITTIIKECRVSFLKEDISNLRLVNKDFANIIPKVLCWLQVNFTPLQDPRLGYEQKDHIDPYRVEMERSNDSLWIRSWQICMLLVGRIYRPISGRSSYPRCNLRSRHIRQLWPYKTNIARWLSCSTYLRGTIKQQVRVHISW